MSTTPALLTLFAAVLAAAACAIVASAAGLQEPNISNEDSQEDISSLLRAVTPPSLSPWAAGLVTAHLHQWQQAQPRVKQLPNQVGHSAVTEAACKALQKELHTSCFPVNTQLSGVRVEICLHNSSNRRLLREAPASSKLEGGQQIFDVSTSSGSQSAAQPFLLLLSAGNDDPLDATLDYDSLYRVRVVSGSQKFVPEVLYCEHGLAAVPLYLSPAAAALKQATQLFDAEQRKVPVTAREHVLNHTACASIDCSLLGSTTGSSSDTPKARLHTSALLLACCPELHHVDVWLWSTNTPLALPRVLPRPWLAGFWLRTLTPQPPATARGTPVDLPVCPATEMLPGRWMRMKHHRHGHASHLAPLITSCMYQWPSERTVANASRRLALNPPGGAAAAAAAGGALTLETPPAGSEPSPLYQDHSCRYTPFINRTDTGWHWQPYGCIMPLLSHQQLGHCLTGRVVCVIGDSHMRYATEGLMKVFAAAGKHANAAGGTAPVIRHLPAQWGAQAIFNDSGSSGSSTTSSSSSSLLSPSGSPSAERWEVLLAKKLLGGQQPSRQCTDIFSSYGHWPASFQAGDRPHSPRRYYTTVVREAKLLALAAARTGARVRWVTSQYAHARFCAHVCQAPNITGGPVCELECSPPTSKHTEKKSATDWRIGPFLQLYNALANAAMAAAGVGVVDTWHMSEVLGETSSDTSHYPASGTVGHAIQRALLHSMCAPEIFDADTGR